MRPPPLQATDGLAAIGLDELDAVAALRRSFDAKYLLSRDALPELLERLAPTHRVLEIEGGRAFEYRTTYFDTRSWAPSATICRVAGAASRSAFGTTPYRRLLL
jgi:hypothetical protein